MVRLATRRLAAKCVSAKQDGAQGRNRTTDTVIFSHVLYQLSYLGAAEPRAVGPERAGGVIDAGFRAVQPMGRREPVASG